MLKYVNGKYVEMTESDFIAPDKTMRIMELKRVLADTDYKAIKYAEGVLSAEEYAQTKAERQAWRDEINRLESDVGV